MRTHAELQLVALLLLAACASRSSTQSAASTPTPLPLESCETRAATFDETSVIIEAGVDAKPVRIIVDSNDDAVRQRSYDDAVRAFGEPHSDARTMQKPLKWGLVQVTDLCGRALPSAQPTPSP